MARKICPWIHINRMRAPVALAASTFLCAIPPASAQTTVFSTFGPGNTYNGTLAYVNGTDPTGQSENLGLPFTVSNSGSLYSITVAEINFNAPAVAHFYLTDDSAKLGNTIASLDSFTFPNVPTFINGSATLTGLSSQHPLLNTGQTYYLYQLETGKTEDGFFLNSIGVTGTIWGSFNGGPFINAGVNTYPAFSIQIADVAAVPEPSTFATFTLAGLGLCGLILRSRKRMLCA